METKVACFLYAARTIPHSTTGVSPAELMFGRYLNSHLDNLRSREKYTSDNKPPMATAPNRENSV